MANNAKTNQKHDGDGAPTGDSDVARQHAGARRRSGPKGGHTSGRRKHLRPERRQQIDASTIGLCYWLIAQRIVREAEEHGDLDCPDPDVHIDEAGERS